MDRSPKKHNNVMQLISKAIEDGRYLDTRHAFERQSLRKITRPEILYVLRNGFHEKRKDVYRLEFESWNYAIRGKTIDRRNIRIAVSFDESDLLIITAIDLDL